MTMIENPAMMKENPAMMKENPAMMKEDLIAAAWIDVCDPVTVQADIEEGVGQGVVVKEVSVKINAI